MDYSMRYFVSYEYPVHVWECPWSLGRDTESVRPVVSRGGKDVNTGSGMVSPSTVFNDYPVPHVSCVVPRSLVHRQGSFHHPQPWGGSGDTYEITG